MTLLQLLEKFKGRIKNGAALVNLEGITVKVRVIDFRLGAYQRIDARIQSELDNTSKWIDASRLQILQREESDK